MFKCSLVSWDGIVLESFTSEKPSLKEAKEVFKSCVDFPAISHNRVRFSGLIAYCFCTIYKLADIYVIYEKTGA